MIVPRPLLHKRPSREDGILTLARVRPRRYEHRSTKRNASCGNLELVKVWRWEAEPLGPPSTQHLPEGCRRDVFYAPETVVDCR
jgi:hypothetical protein